MVPGATVVKKDETYEEFSQVIPRFGGSNYSGESLTTSAIKPVATDVANPLSFAGASSFSTFALFNFQHMVPEDSAKTIDKLQRDDLI